MPTYSEEEAREKLHSILAKVPPTAAFKEAIEPYRYHSEALRGPLVCRRAVLQDDFAVLYLPGTVLGLPDPHDLSIWTLGIQANSVIVAGYKTGGVVGAAMIALKGASLELVSMHVDRFYRQQGVEAHLLSCIKSLLNKEAPRSLVVASGISETAREFFLKNGLRIQGDGTLQYSHEMLASEKSLVTILEPAVSTSTDSNQDAIPVLRPAPALSVSRPKTKSEKTKSTSTSASDLPSDGSPAQKKIKKKDDDFQKKFERYFPDYVEELRRLDLPEIHPNQQVMTSMEDAINSKVGSVVLVGDPGTGKSATTNAFILAMADGKVRGIPKGTRIYKLDKSIAFVKTKYFGQMEERISLIKEMIARGGTIYFSAEEIHTLDRLGTWKYSESDFLEQLKPELVSNQIKFIGNSTKEEFAKSIGRRVALASRFKIIPFPAPTREQLLLISKNLLKRHNLPDYPEQLLEALLRLTDRYDELGAQPRKIDRFLEYLSQKLASKERVPGWDEVTALAESYFHLPPGSLNIKVQRQRNSEFIAAIQQEVGGFGDDVDSPEGVSEQVRQAFASANVWTNSKKPSVLIMLAGSDESRIPGAIANHLRLALVKIDMGSFNAVSSLSSEDLKRDIAAAVQGKGEMILLFNNLEKSSLEIQASLFTILSNGELLARSGGETNRVFLPTVRVILATNAGRDQIIEHPKNAAALRDAIIESGVSEDLVDLSLLVAAPPPRTIESFIKILTMEFERVANDVAAQHPHIALSFPDRDTYISLLAQQHWDAKRSAPIPGHAAMDKISRQVRSRIFEHPQYSTQSYDQGQVVGSACEKLSVVITLIKENTASVAPIIPKRAKRSAGSSIGPGKI